MKRKGSSSKVQKRSRRKPSLFWKRIFFGILFAGIFAGYFFGTKSLLSNYTAWFSEGQERAFFQTLFPHFDNQPWNDSTVFLGKKIYFIRSGETFHAWMPASPWEREYLTTPYNEVAGFVMRANLLTLNGTAEVWVGMDMAGRVTGIQISNSNDFLLGFPPFLHSAGFLNCYRGKTLEEAKECSVTEKEVLLPGLNTLSRKVKENLQFLSEHREALIAKANIFSYETTTSHG